MERTVNPKVVGSNPTIGAFVHARSSRPTVSNKRLAGTPTASAPRRGPSQVRQTLGHVVVNVSQWCTCFDLGSDRGYSSMPAPDRGIVGMGPASADLHEGAAEGEGVDTADPSAGGCDNHGA